MQNILMIFLIKVERENRDINLSDEKKNYKLINNSHRYFHLPKENITIDLQIYGLTYILFEYFI